MSFWRVCRSLSFLMTLYMRLSSANSRMSYDVRSGISLIYARNRSGPSTVPCGTPDITSSLVDLVPSSTTRWVRFLRNDWIQQQTGPWIPQYSSLYRSRECGTLSKAFSKSRRIVSTGCSRCHHWTVRSETRCVDARSVYTFNTKSAELRATWNIWSFQKIKTKHTHKVM